LIVTVVATWKETEPELSRAGPLVPIAVLLIAVGLLAAARGWAALQQSGLRRRSMVGFIAAQPAKYLPVGGAMQAAGQVELTTSEGGSRREVAWSFLVHAGVQVTAALFVALLLLTDVSTPAWLKLVILVLASVALLSLRQSVVATVVKWLSKLTPRLASRGELPPTRSLVESAGWTIVPLVMSGISFGLLLGVGDSPGQLTSTAGAFAAAWVVGFLLFPLPSGLGAREAVLVALIPSFPPAQILAVSLVHRFSTIVAELILLAAVSKSAFLGRERSG
jgi:hypothetical protein